MAVREIIDKILDNLSAQLERRQITLTLDESAYDLLMAQGYSQAYGAREMERTVQHLIAGPLSSLIVFGKLADGAAIRASAKGEEIGFDVSGESVVSHID